MSSFREVRGERKADSTWVTQADLRAEEVLVEGLQRAFPGDSICGEEGTRIEGGDRTWYLDPIDGTGAYLEGLAHFCSVLGLVDAEGVALGAVWMPRTGEYFFAERGRGAWRDGLLLPALSEEALDRNTVIYVPSRFAARAQLTLDIKARNLGSVAAHLCLVASGAAGAAIVAGGWRPWDVAGPFCLLNEVGALARDRENRIVEPEQPSGSFVAGRRAVLEKILAPGSILLRGNNP